MTLRTRLINVRGNLIDLDIPKVMGVINVTPDSFYKGSRFTSKKVILEAVSKMLKDGADFIDIGGFSSRPGAVNIPVEEEKRRVLDSVRMVNREFPGITISIDTFRSEIAMEAVLECGAAIINDISGGDVDSRMFHTVARLQVPYVIMHMKGLPWAMEKKPVYENIVADILKWFGERIYRLQKMGVKDIIIDPGFGFGKTIEHNFELLNHLSDLSIAELPIMVGISRKSMIWKTLEITPEGALTGTSVLNTVALLHGADILRVHDVKEAVQAIKLVGKLKEHKP